MKPEGQAFDLHLTTEISGWKELTFSLLQTVNGKRNFRWDFMPGGDDMLLTVEEEMGFAGGDI